MDLGRLEKTRRRHQERLEKVTGRAERNRLGQFATPFDVASQVASYAVDLLDTGEKIRFLDPAVGTGALYSALARTAPAERLERAVGYETDGRYADVAEDVWARVGLRVIRDDFTDDPPAEESNLVIANPPYVRHHHLSTPTKHRLRRVACASSGIRVGGLASLWAYFILVAHRTMTEGAVAAWILPAELGAVSYASAVRRYLTRDVQLLRVHRFDPDLLLFGDAMVSTTVVVFRNRSPGTNHRPVFTYGPFDDPRRVETPTIRWLRGRKWVAVGQSEQAPGVTLGDLFDVRRGLVTGANSFFVMERTRADTLGLPEEHLKSVIPPPKRLPGNVIPPGGPPEPRMVLLDCDLTEPAHPALVDYLRTGERQGLHRRYLLSRRTPWWRQEQRPPALFLCVYMGRKGPRGSPFRFLWNRSAATATNAYLLLYPRGHTADMLADSRVASVVHEQLNSIGLDRLLRRGRAYAEGLHKIEPGELARVPAGAVGRTLGMSALPLEWETPDGGALTA